MLEKILNFKHDSDDLPTALGFSEEIDNKCREIIHFAAFTNYFIKNDFFDDQEAPSNLTTLTGILEKALNICKTEEEKIYTLFVFRSIHKNCSQALGAYEAFEEEKDEKAKKKMQMLMELVELKALSDDEEDRSNFITPKDMFKKINAAKNNMYNFDKYYSVVNEQN
jgi:hypothetical protein